MSGPAADLEARAAAMPSQGGVAIAPALRRLAADAPRGAAIVEVGAWLGAATAQLALGALAREDRPTIHVYDRFVASAREAEKAAAFGVRLRRRQDTLPVVRDLLAPFGVPMVFHKGPLEAQTWDATTPIGLYVDDAAKQPPAFHHVLRTFGPAWIPGATAIVLMDYHYWRKFPPGPAADALRAQHDVVTAHPDCFAPIEGVDAAGTSAAFFRYLRPLDFARLPAPAAAAPTRRRPLFSRLAAALRGG